jgi:hypothetical protein
MRRVAPARPPWRVVALALWPPTVAAVLAGCARPDAATLAAIAPRERPALSGVVHRSLHAPRPLSDTEGEVVVAAAIAAHEMRRP